MHRPDIRGLADCGDVIVGWIGEIMDEDQPLKDKMEGSGAKRRDYR